MFNWSGHIRPKDLLTYDLPYLIRAHEGLYGTDKDTTICQDDMFLVFKKQTFGNLEILESKNKAGLTLDSKCLIIDLPENPDHVYGTVKDLLKRVPRFVVLGKKWKNLEKDSILKVGKLTKNPKGEQCLMVSKYGTDPTPETILLPLSMKGNFKEHIDENLPCTISELFGDVDEIPLPRTVTIIDKNPKIRTLIGSCECSFTIVNKFDSEPKLLCFHIPSPVPSVMILPSVINEEFGEPIFSMAYKDPTWPLFCDVFDTLKTEVATMLQGLTFSDPDVHNGPKFYSIDEISNCKIGDAPYVTSSENGDTWTIKMNEKASEYSKIQDQDQSNYYCSMKPTDSREDLDAYVLLHPNEGDDEGIYEIIPESEKEIENELLPRTPAKGSIERKGAPPPIPTKAHLVGGRRVQPPIPIKPKPDSESGDNVVEQKLQRTDLVVPKSNLKNPPPIPLRRKGENLLVNQEEKILVNPEERTEPKEKTLDDYPNDLSKLSVKDLANLLKLYKLSKFADIVNDEIIDGECFVELTDVEFKEEPFKANSFEVKKLVRLTKGKIRCD